MKTLHEVDPAIYSKNYFSGENSQYPANNSYLNPESDYRFKFQDLLGWISTRVKSGKILDIGQGPGHLNYWSRKRELPFKVFGVDISPILFSKNNSNKNAADALSTNLCFSSDSFDGALISDMLEHIDPENAKKTLAETNRVLKRGGWLFLNIPNAQAWSTASDKDPGHVWLPTIEEIKKIIIESGFKSNSIGHYTRGFPFSLIFRKVFSQDFHFPVLGRSIFICAKK